MHLDSPPPSCGLKHDKRAVFTVHLTTLWNRITRSQAIPEDIDVDKLYIAIRDRLRDPEWEVRLHALRVLGELLPISKNALAFPFDEVVNNLGHSSPTVRKASLDALKVFCLHCEEPDCAVRAIVDRCNYDNANKLLSTSETESNIITGLILSIPSVIAILRRRRDTLDTYQVTKSLGLKLFNATYRDVALRSMIKLRRICGTDNFMEMFSKLSPQIQDKFRLLCEVYDDDSFDVYYGPRRGQTRVFRPLYSEGSDDSTVDISNKVCYSELPAFNKDISSDDSQRENDDDGLEQCDVSGKVIIETEITFDSDTAITMTVLEESGTEPESDRNDGSDGYESYSSDKNILKVFSETESEDTDVVISTQKRVRFGGEMVKIRTPDSDNLLASEDDSKSSIDVPLKSNSTHEIKEIATIQETVHTPQQRKQKKSGIPLPIIPKSEINVRKIDISNKATTMAKKKSKSLSELYDYFRMKNNTELLNFQNGISVSVKDSRKPQLALNFKDLSKSHSVFTLNVTESTYRENIPSPVELHREVEVLHNLQRSPPTRSPRSQRPLVQLDQDDFVLSLMRSSPERSRDGMLLDPLTSPSQLQPEYEWETLKAVPLHIVEQLHNTENWISAVRAADQLHRALLDPGSVHALEASGSSLAEHMWALGAAVGAARAPAESAVCALFRGAYPAAARRMLPALIKRLVRAPPSAALSHALLARLTLPQLIDLIFDVAKTGVDMKAATSAQLQGAWCVARAAGPAAVLAAVRHRLAGEPHCEYFCEQLRNLLRRPTENLKPLPGMRTSQLPLPVTRRRARSTPPPAPHAPRAAPRRLRPLADSAPLAGSSSARDLHLKPLFPILLHYMESSPFSSHEDDTRKKGSLPEDNESNIFFVPTGTVDETVAEKIIEDTPQPERRSPSIHVEDFSEQTADDNTALQKASPQKKIEPVSVQDQVDGHATCSLSGSHASLSSNRTSTKSPASRVHSPEGSISITSPHIVSPVSISRVSSPRSESPAPSLHTLSAKSMVKEVTVDTPPSGRDVRAALAACIAAPRPQEDWEVIVRGLRKVEEFALDPTAHAPTASWRAVARATATHVRSLRSRVARTACCALGSLYQARGKILEPETEEAAGALLDRAADVNRFLRGDAEEALTRVACGVTAARAVTALVRRGASHRAGPVRAAAACALAELAIRGGAAKILDLPSEPRALMLRTAVDLLGDASPDARAHARRLCVALAEDSRFRPLLKDSLPASKYKTVEKSVDQLRCR